MFFIHTFQKRVLSNIHQDRDVLYIPFEKAKNICFVFDLNEEKILEAVKYLTLVLREKNIEYSGLAINMAKNNFPESVLDHRIQLLTRMNVSFIGTPEVGIIEKVTGRNVDIFIDFSSAYSYTHDYIARISKAQFIVGRYNYTDNPFDLVIGCDGEEKSPLDYLKHVIHYLTSIKSSR